MVVTQDGGQTTMRWSRLVNNGNPNGAQISPPGSPTVIVYAVGNGNTFQNDVSSVMSWMELVLIPHENTVELTTGLSLSWTVVGDRLDFQAVLSSAAWQVFSSCMW